MPAKPMLDGFELQQVQKIEAEDNEAVTQHRVPGLESDFLQDLGRRATRIVLNGVLTGPTVKDSLKQLREKFQKAVAVPFVADVATAVSVDKVLIEECNVRELAGKPERFEYSLALREFLEPPKPGEEPVPPPPPEKKTTTLEVEVIVDGQPNFDFSTVEASVKGSKDDGSDFQFTFAEADRNGNVWTRKEMPPGDYTAAAVVKNPPPMSGSVKAKVPEGQTTHVKIVLEVGALIANTLVVHYWFDKAFVEPCLRGVLTLAAKRVADHPEEKLIVMGHTDLTGSSEYNQSLSERRARGVYAFLTFGRDHDKALAEWNNLRKPQAGVLPTINDHWGTREYQYMLQDLDFYQAPVDGLEGPATAAAVKKFQQEKSLPVTGTVDDATWSALIEAYLAQDSFAVPESQFFANCAGEILKWTGSGEQDPIRNTEDAFRPNRRTELLFVNAKKIPGEIAQPVTLDLPAKGFVNNGWCLGPGDPNHRSSFTTRDPKVKDKFLIQPAEPGTVGASGSISNEDGTPLANASFVLIAPDGENMSGERPSAPNAGTPIPGRTDAQGAFSFAQKPKGVGIYILRVEGALVARLAEDSVGSGKGNTVCKHLDQKDSVMKVVVSPADADPARKLRATIFDRFGQPRKRTQVEVVFSDGTQSSATTNDTGEFVMELNQPSDVAKIQYQITDGDPGDETNFSQFFVDVEGVDSDEGVRRRLHNMGFSPDTDLKRAILSFQVAQGIVQSGIADDPTKAALAAVHDGTEPLKPQFTFDESALPAEQLLGDGPPP
jgi:outer membrane protein OmpA-like peptidoglycan-associated protein